MPKINHLNDVTFDMVMRTLDEAMASKRPTIMKENIELAIRLLKRPEKPPSKPTQDSE